MKLLTKEIIGRLPRIGSDDGEDPMIICKFFSADAGWTWYATEGEREDNGDFVFYGYVVGPFPEWGNFRLSELEGIRGHVGLSVERDLHFRRQRFSELRIALQWQV